MYYIVQITYMIRFEPAVFSPALWDAEKLIFNNNYLLMCFRLMPIYRIAMLDKFTVCHFVCCQISWLWDNLYPQRTKITSFCWFKVWFIIFFLRHCWAMNVSRPQRRPLRPSRLSYLKACVPTALWKKKLRTKSFPVYDRSIWMEL